MPQEGAGLCLKTSYLYHFKGAPPHSAQGKPRTVSISLVSGTVQVLFLWFAVQSCEVEVTFTFHREGTEARRGERPCPPPHRAAGWRESRCALRSKPSKPSPLWMATLVPTP